MLRNLSDAKLSFYWTTSWLMEFPESLAQNKCQLILFFHPYFLSPRIQSTMPRFKLSYNTTMLLIALLILLVLANGVAAFGAGNIPS